jgi:C4-dicarboxylate transporter DctM subunit
VVLATALMIQIYFQSAKWDAVRLPRASWSERWTHAKSAILPLGTPLIIFGGILGGFATPTEAAVLAVVYSLVVGMLVYREISVRKFFAILMEAGVTSGVIMLLLGMATILGWLMASEGLPQSIAGMLASMPGGLIVFLIVINIIFLAFGMILEGAPALILLVPIVLPVAQKLGIDPVHFGTMLIANQGIAVMTPPLGISLFVACRVGKVSIGEVSRPLAPYLFVMGAMLLVLAFVPEVSLALPKLLGLHK